MPSNALCCFLVNSITVLSVVRFCMSRVTFPFSKDISASPFTFARSISEVIPIMANDVYSTGSMSAERKLTMSACDSSIFLKSPDAANPSPFFWRSNICAVCTISSALPPLGSATMMNALSLNAASTFPTAVYWHPPLSFKALHTPFLASASNKFSRFPCFDTRASIPAAVAFSSMKKYTLSVSFNPLLSGVATISSINLSEPSNPLLIISVIRFTVCLPLPSVRPLF